MFMKKKLKLQQNEVLRYTKDKKSANTVRRYFIQWRLQQIPPLPLRCDNEECYFHTSSLVWNDKEIHLILDHKNGINSDNRPKNLRFLCPNCDSQLQTRGGGNKGRTEKSEGGFAFVSKEGKKSYVLPCETGFFKVTGNSSIIQQNLVKDSGLDEVLNETEDLKQKSK